MKNKSTVNLSFVLIIIFSSLANTQDFDEAYLESLPEDVREEVLKEAESKKDKEKPVYRRPSSMIDKSLDESEKENDALKYRVKRFGSDFFSKMQSSFMPINEPNMDGSYILDFGDILEIQLVGQESYEDEFPIKRDGSVNIPDIGKIFIAGLSLDNANKLIVSKVKESFIGTEAFITLKNVRDIQVLVSGNAFNPGLYTLNGNSNIFQALYSAGGVNEIGSYRLIKHIRDGEVIHIFDLYDVFIKGISTTGNRLKSGDSLLIPPAERIVNINGGVKRPLLYELINNEGLDNLIMFANGFSHDVNKDVMFLESYKKGNYFRLDVNDSNLETIKPEYGDTLHIGKFDYKKVLVEGAVNIPGEYLITDGTTLSEVISRAGGYKESAYPFGGYLENERTMLINQEANKKLYNQFIENLTLMTSDEGATNIAIVMDQVKNAPVSGRIKAEFDLDVIQFTPTLDTLLEDNDRLIIPYITQQVYVFGQVNNEGTVRYQPNKDINFYIRNVGGFDDLADEKNVFVVHPNGKTVILEAQKRLSFLGSTSNADLIYPGSVIYIPRKSIEMNRSQIASVWAPIVSSFALTATSLSVLKDN